MNVYVMRAETKSFILNGYTNIRNKKKFGGGEHDHFGRSNGRDLRTIMSVEQGWPTYGTCAKSGALHYYKWRISPREKKSMFVKIL